MQGRQACNRCEFGSLVLYTVTFLCESCFIIGVTGSPPLLCAWLRADQGGAVPGWEDPRPGPGALHTKVTSGHGARLQLCHMPGRSPGEHPLPNPLLHWPLSEGRCGRHPRKPTGRRKGVGLGGGEGGEVTSDFTGGRTGYLIVQIGGFLPKAEEKPIVCFS